MRTAALLSLLVLVSACSESVPLPPPPSNVEALEGEVREAIQEQHARVSGAPSSAEERQLLGLLYLANGRASDAATCLQQAASLDSGNPRHWYHLAMALEESDQIDAALQAMDRARQLQPNHLATAWRPGFWLLENGRTTEALALFEAAAARDRIAARPAPDGAAHRIGRARCLLELDRPDEAILILEELQQLIDHYYATYLMAQAYRRAGRIEEAEAITAEGNLSPPSYPDPWLDARGDAQRGYEGRVSRIDALIDSGRLDEAMRRLTQASAQWPDDVNLLNRRAAICRATGDQKGWIRALRSAVRIDPDDESSQYNLSVALQNAGDLRAAMNHAHLAIKANDAFVPGWLQIGRLTIQQAGLDQGTRPDELDAINTALISFDKAAQLGIDAPHDMLLYGHVLFRGRRLDDARTVLTRLKDRSDAPPQAWAILSEVHTAAGDHRSALGTAIDGLNRFPSSPELQRIIERYRRAAGGQTP